MYVIIFDDDHTYLYSANLTSLGYRPIKVATVELACFYQSLQEAKEISKNFKGSRVIPNV